MSESLKKILIFDKNDKIYFKLKKSISPNIYSLKNIINPYDYNTVFQDFQPNVVIVDPFSYGSFGFKLIDNLINHESSPVIIIMSEKIDPEIIVKMIKQGVYDYMSLDGDPEYLSDKIAGACDAPELSRLKTIHERELRVIKGHQVASGSRTKHKSDFKHSALIRSIRANFSQGKGIGTIITLISVINGLINEENDCLKIDKSLFQLLLDNSNQVEKIIQTFEILEKIGYENPEFTYESYESIYYLIQDEIGSIANFTYKYNKKIKVSDKINWNGKYIKCIPDYFRMIIKELLINAVKFSPQNSEIMVFLEDHNHGISISVLNKTESDNGNYTGIPDEYQDLIFEPFFRLNHMVFEDIPSLDFGLGLTQVNLLIKKMNGSIQVSNLESYIKFNEKPEKYISMEIRLPAYRKTIGGYIQREDFMKKKLSDSNQTILSKNLCRSEEYLQI